MTCAILVSCVPAVPKAFAGTGRVVRLTETLRRWARLLTVRSETPSRSSWPPPSLQLSVSRKGVYRKLNENGTPRDHLLPMSGTTIDVPAQVQVASRGESRIIRTTHFTAQEEFIDIHPESNEFNLQHPWTSNIRISQIIVRGFSCNGRVSHQGVKVDGSLMSTTDAYGRRGVASLNPFQKVL